MMFSSKPRASGRFETKEILCNAREDYVHFIVDSFK